MWCRMKHIGALELQVGSSGLTYNCVEGKLIVYNAATMYRRLMLVLEGAHKDGTHTHAHTHIHAHTHKMYSFTFSSSSSFSSSISTFLMSDTAVMTREEIAAVQEEGANRQETG